MSNLKFLTSCAFLLLTYVYGRRQENVQLLTTQEQSIVQSSYLFGCKLFRKILNDSNEENVFVSPLSVSLALGMAYNGARGNTKTQMQSTLEYEELSLEEINQAYGPVIDLLTSIDPSVTMDIANSIWHTDGFEVYDEFITDVSSFFQAVVQAIDFSDPSAAATINSWVEEKTNGKIDEIVEDSIDPAAKMFIINAIYFKGAWTEKFDPSNTKDQTFYQSDTKTKTVKMMSITSEFPYMETSEFQAVDLPYGNGFFSMTIFLPKDGISLNELIANFDDDKWKEWTGNTWRPDVYLELPRFEIEFEQSLKSTLTALGMSDVFSSNADFSGISAEPLYVDDVKHKTYVKVNEEGTEAAAVTSVGIKMLSAPAPSIDMIVNRPFVFVIQDSHSGAMLFMGKVVDPTEPNVFSN